MAKRFVVDIETDGLLDTCTKIHSLVLYDLTEEKLISLHGARRILFGLRMMMEADELIMHNGIGFDIPAIEKICPWFKTKAKIIDTQIWSFLVFPEVKDRDFRHKDFPKKLAGSYSLEAFGYRLGILKGDYGKQAHAWDRWSPAMQEYCEQDVRVTVALYKKLLDAQLPEDAVKMEHDLAFIMARQERAGFHFDTTKAKALVEKLRVRHTAIEGELKALKAGWWRAGEVIRPTKSITYKDPTKADRTQDAPFTPVFFQEFNPGSRQQLGRLLIEDYGWEPKETTETGEPKLSEEVLEGLKIPIAPMIAELFLVNKRLGQIADGQQAWLKAVRNGRIHGRVKTSGAVTRRATHSNPNVAQVPSVSAEYGHECRELFTVPEGFLLVGADASGLELRCLGHYLAVFDKGAYAAEVVNGDVHTANQNAAGLETRNQAKTFIYAFLYGAGDEKIGSIVGKGKAAGRRLKEKFLSATPALAKLKAAVDQKVSKTGKLMSLDGVPLKIRSSHAALNTLLQSAGAIVCKRWIVEVERKLQSLGYHHGWDGDYVFCAWVHDEIQVAVRESIADELGKIFVETIREVASIYGFNCPLDGEYKVGRNWAETH